MGDQIVHNAIFYGMSNNSNDQYPFNKASSFTNNLKNRIVLDANVKYNVNLHNFHVPLHEISLVANDFYESNLQYNIGLFYHDPESHFGGYVLDKTTVKNCSIWHLIEMSREFIHKIANDKDKLTIP